MTACKMDNKNKLKKVSKPNYLTPNYNQDTFINICPQEQILVGSFEYAIKYLIDKKLNLDLFDARYSNSSTGRKAYPPAVLLKIIFLAYSMGITSSRTIEKLCRVHVTFMALSGFVYPDHSTVSAFVSRLENEIVDLFEQVLMICDEEGLIGKKMFAIDGCKLPSNASKESSGTHTELKKKSKRLRTAVKRMVKKHKEQDAGFSDEQIKQKEEKQIKKLNAQADRIDNFLNTHEPRMGRRKKEVQSNITDNDSAKMQTSHGAIQGANGVAIGDSKNQIIMQAEAFGQGSEQSVLEPCIEDLQATLEKLNPGVKKEDTLNNSILLADSGYHSEENLKHLSEQNINSYIADNQFRKRDPRFKDADRFKTTKHGKKPTKKNKKFRVDDFIYDPENSTCTCPAAKALWLTSQNLIEKKDGSYYVFRGYEQDCKNCELRKACLQKEDQQSPRAVAIRVEKAAPKNNHTARMKEKIDSDEGRHIFSHRFGIIEPIFGNIRTTKGLDRFSMRGKGKINAQWKLFCIIHNLEKIKHYGTVIH